ncbi:ABC transporter permease [Desmospora profundinema]|uniref:ABC-2 type transport system permease protein n=1 Tax=Desmospora profundinema TaxID=1571184 RepID=A0ABU1IJX5_9BACL|nr:ABC transporter permease [Desmospora profundinema]MDR6224842.1 ABC-2 type transport system permease protein [Desmospora profundinema]
MKSIFLLQWRRFRRAPGLVLSFSAMTVFFVFLIAGFMSDHSLTLYVYSDSAWKEEQRDIWLKKLNEADGMEFQWTEENEARQAVAGGEVPLAVKLMESDYRILAAADDPNRYLVDQHLKRVYGEELRLRAAAQGGDESPIRAEVERLLAEPALKVETTSLAGEGDSFTRAVQLQGLFGMTLFFAIYTITYSLSTVAEEKRRGTWDRLILSPLRKWQIYLGHLLYCFVIGYVQVLVIFLLFQYAFGFDLGDRFGTILFITGCYTFAIVALGMLLIGLVQTPEQLQAVIPIVAVSMAMLGGAYWPLEAVSNEVMLAISRVIPVTYGMDALKGAALESQGVMDLVHPLSMMLLFGVLCMGIGINLMERRKG